VDALGNALWFILTGGEEHDMEQSSALVDGFRPDAVIADKGYDSDAFVETIKELGAQSVIPSRANRKQPRDTD
jgi:transposase